MNVPVAAFIPRPKNHLLSVLAALDGHAQTAEKLVSALIRALHCRLTNQFLYREPDL